MRRHKKNKIKDLILNNLIENRKEYIILSLLFIVGIIIGIIFINNTSNLQKDNINSYINNYINLIKDNNLTLSSMDLFKASLKRNLITTLILWFLGSTIIGMPIIYLVILYKGCSLGYTLASILASLGTGKGLLFINISIILQYIIYIPCILVIGVSGIKLYKNIVNNKNRDNIKLQIIRHTIICTCVFIALIIGSLVETYISGGLINNFSKYL